MIRPWENFTAVQGQVVITSILVTRRSRGFIALVMDTSQKYPEVRSWTGMEVMVGPSEHTSPQTYDPDKPVTCVVFPESVRGWDVTYRTGRYDVSIVLTRPGSPGRMALRERSEAWRFLQFSRAKKKR